MVFNSMRFLFAFSADFGKLRVLKAVEYPLIKTGEEVKIRGQRVINNSTSILIKEKNHEQKDRNQGRSFYQH